MQFKLEMEIAKGFDNYTLEDFELMKEQWRKDLLLFQHPKPRSHAAKRLLKFRIWPNDFVGTKSSLHLPWGELVSAKVNGSNSQQLMGFAWSRFDSFKLLTLVL